MSAPATEPDLNLDDFEVVLPPVPYPGLRPFQKPEWPVFFGRETITDEVIGHLIAHKLVVVHGDSGCGKSSLLRAGVFARLEQDNARGGLTWRTCATEPGDAPLLGFARQLARLDGRPDDEARTIEMRRILNCGRDAPAILAGALLRAETDHICLLVDQFEELFAFARARGRDEASLLVSFLVGLLEAPPRGLYAVVAMRSEFLGACAQFPGFAEAVNRTQYLLPRMAHLDLVRAIREPAPLYNGHVSLDLAERLIVDAGGSQDHLPLIQHGLMLLHRRKLFLEKAPSESTPWRLGLEDYQEAGVAQLLSDHADALCPTPGSPGSPVVERVFRALTAINADGRAIRRPQAFGELVRVTGADAATLDEVLGPFRAEGASLLRPYGDTALVPSDRIDISHEALIRCWKRIADPTSGWLRREFQDGLIWQSLLVQSDSFDRDATNVLSPATAKERDEWLTDRNEAWAERYKGGWAGVQTLVHASVEAARAAEKAGRRRALLTVLSISLVALLLALLSLDLWWGLKQRDEGTAASLWVQLDFVNRQDAVTDDELNALREIRLARPGVRDVLMRRVQQDPAKLVRPASVLRALYLEWPADAASETWTAVTRALANEKRPARVSALLSVMEAMPGRLPAVQAQAALESAINALVEKNYALRSSFLGIDPDLAVANALVLANTTPEARAVRALARRIPADQAPRAIETLVSAVTRATAEGTLAGLAFAIEAVPANLTADQAASVFGTLAKALSGTAESGAGYDVHDRQQLFGRAMNAIATKVSAGQPQAFAPLLAALSATDDPGTIVVLASAAVDGGTPVPIADEQARVVVATLLKKLASAPSDSDFQDACAAIKAVAPHLGAGQAGMVRSPLLQILGTVPSKARTLPIYLARAVAEALGALPGQIPAEEARVTRARFLNALAQIASADALNAYDTGTVVSAIAAVPAPLPGDQAEKVTAVLVKAIATTTDRNQLEPLALAIADVGAKLPPAQAESALTAVVHALAETEETDPLNALAAAVRSLPGTLTAERVQAALGPLVNALVRTRDNFNSAQMTALSTAVQALLGKLDSKDIGPAVDLLAKSLRTATDANQLNAMLLAVTAAADKLTPEQLKEFRADASSLLAWSPTVSLSVTAAKALGSPALRVGGTVEDAQRIVDYLKFPTASGEATDVLLEALRSMKRGAPGKEAGLDATLDWIAREYPPIDLDGRPTFPAPRGITVQSSGSRGAGF